MQVEELISKSEVLLEALPYIQGFRGSTFVVKYGGSFMDDPDPTVRAPSPPPVFSRRLGSIVVVHGGGKAITVRWRRPG
jgi:acetylglutamate kinase